MSYGRIPRNDLSLERCVQQLAQFGERPAVQHVFALQPAASCHGQVCKIAKLKSIDRSKLYCNLA